nr:MAG TPA: hypothetical protein [Caudoviricetes sp.]
MVTPGSYTYLLSIMFNTLIGVFPSVMYILILFSAS